MKWAIALLLVPLVGCADPAPCAIDATTTVTKVQGTDIFVENGTLILHAGKSDIYRADDAGCVAIDIADVKVGDALGHDADAIAESYPAQAWPKTIVVR